MKRTTAKRQHRPHGGDNRRSSAARVRPKTGRVGSSAHLRPSWRWGLALAALLLGGLGALANPLLARLPAHASSLLPAGAKAELAHSQREQALIRGEGTAALLRALASAPILSEEER